LQLVHIAFSVCSSSIHKGLKTHAFRLQFARPELQQAAVLA